MPCVFCIGWGIIPSVLITHDYYRHLFPLKYFPCQTIRNSADKFRTSSSRIDSSVVKVSIKYKELLSTFNVSELPPCAIAFILSIPSSNMGDITLVEPEHIPFYHLYARRIKQDWIVQAVRSNPIISRDGYAVFKLVWNSLL